MAKATEVYRRQNLGLNFKKRQSEKQPTMSTEISEARLQEICYIYLHNNYPAYRGLFFRIKNEGTNKISGARDKAMGVVPGVADMCLLHKGTAVFIEFKSATGKQSEAQKIWQSRVEQVGFSYYLINDFETFKELCRSLLD